MKKRTVIFEPFPTAKSLRLETAHFLQSVIMSYGIGFRFCRFYDLIYRFYFDNICIAGIAVGFTAGHYYRITRV